MSADLQAANPSPGPAGLIAAYDQHRGELLRFLRARTRDPAEAEDAIQDLWLRLQDLRPGPIANARAYLFQAANHLVQDRARERRRRAARDHRWTEQSYVLSPGVDGALQAVDPGQGPESQIEEDEERIALQSAIAELPEGARRAFCLHKLEGLGHAEVAARLGISRSGVEKHIAVAMKNLRRLLADWGPRAAAASPPADSPPGTR